MTTISSSVPQIVSQSKVVTPSQAGIMVTHLTPGNLNLRQGGTTQNKVVNPAQTGLLPTQFLVPSGSTSQTSLTQQCKLEIYMCLK
jgi:hypothetical protein